MTMIDSIEQAPHAGDQLQSRVPHTTFRYRGRVRTGCLICRARKVKCDEQRPSCNKCTSLRKDCVYPTKRNNQRDLELKRQDNMNSLDIPASQSPQGRPNQGPETFTPHDGVAPHHSQIHSIVLDGQPLRVNSTLSTDQNAIINNTILDPAEGITSPEEPEILSSLRPSPSCQQEPRDIAESPSTVSLMTSQDIYLCTSIDYMAATRTFDHPSFSSFIDEVNPPLISPFDPMNWMRFKTLCIDISMHNKAVCTAVLAVQVLYKAQVNGLHASHAVSLYKDATTLFMAGLDSCTQDLDTTLILSFLLCLFETILPSETETILSQSDGLFVAKLEEAALGRYYSPVALRISSWLRLVHAATRRGGHSGILSITVNNHLPNTTIELPSLGLFDKQVDVATCMYDNMCASIFTFYLQLQNISTEVANLSHYHRSRTTGEDQEEVSELMADIKTRLYSIWQARPGLMRLEPFEIRRQLSQHLAESLISLVGVTTTGYYAEIVEIGRTLSDPPLASPEAKHAMRCIRNIVEGCEWNWNTYSNSAGVASLNSYARPSKLDPGYLRPLFIYAIESIHKGDTQWAIDRMMEINNHICRSEFFARFANSLTEAQCRLGRRVTTKYFCYQKFGVVPPFL